MRTAGRNGKETKVPKCIPSQMLRVLPSDPGWLWGMKQEHAQDRRNGVVVIVRGGGAWIELGLDPVLLTLIFHK